MYRTVLVPLDGSALAEQALPFAQGLVRRTGGRLVLVRCAGAGSSLVRDLPVAQAEAVAEATVYLQGLAGLVPGSPAPGGRPAEPGAGATETEIGVAYGAAAEGILAEAAWRQADAIVMTVYGCSGVGRWHFGSVADAVVRRAEVPVLLVPAAGAGAQNAWTSDHALRILVPLDGSSSAEAVLDALRALAGATRVRVLLLRAVEPRLPWAVAPDPRAEPAIDLTAEVAAARRYLETVADTLRPTGAAVAVHATVGYPEAEIAAQAHKGHVDLVAMTTWGRSGPTRAGLGSVAAAAVQLAGIPLLLVRPGIRPQTAAAALPERTPATCAMPGRN